MGNSEEKLDRMFEAVRNLKPETAALEWGFESRLLAKIHERRESRLVWFHWVWRFVPVFMVLTLLIGFTSLAIRPERSQDLFASITSGQEESLVMTYLTGE